MNSALEIDASEVVEHLKYEVKLKSVYRQILSRKIVSLVAKEHNIFVTPAEIQEEANQFRYRNKLENASQTYDWLNDQLITPEDWEEGIRRHLLSEKLALHLFGNQVESYFALNKAQYEKASLYHIVLTEQPLAQEIFYQIEEEETSFFEAAHLYDKEENRRLICGFEGKLFRWQVSADLSAQIFGADPGELIGVIHSGDDYEIWMVEEFIVPELTPEVRHQILTTLFQEWLEGEINYRINMSK